MDRKAMLDAIDFLAQQNKTSKKIHYFVVTDSDRIARPDDIGEAFLLEWDIEATGVRIITINSKRDNQTDEWKLMNGLQYLIAWYERMKTLRRTMNGRVTSMKSWWRPLSHVPLWYIREKISEKIYKDTIDPVLWPIIKEWLELYAHTPTLTKAQLQKFWFDKGLRTKKTTNKLYRSFIDKTFLDYRLYFYAWYV